MSWIDFITIKGYIDSPIRIKRAISVKRLGISKLVVVRTRGNGGIV